MNCPYCSKEIQEDSISCAFCGRAVFSYKSSIVPSSMPQSKSTKASIYLESANTISQRRKTALLLAFLLSFVSLFAGTAFFAANYVGSSDEAGNFGFQRALILSAAVFVLCFILGFLKFNIIEDDIGVTKTTELFGFSMQNWHIGWDELVSILKVGTYIRLEPRNHPVQLITFGNFISKDEMIAKFNEKEAALFHPVINGSSAPSVPKISTPVKRNKQKANITKIGILFDIDELGGGLYGYTAYKIFFAAIDTRQIAGCTLSDGDSNETLIGGANQYCIAVEAPDNSAITIIKKTLSKSNAKGLLPLSARFIDEAHLRRERLVPSTRVSSTGELVNCTTGWVMEAWTGSRKARG